jgi:hypothetical protein
MKYTWSRILEKDTNVTNILYLQVWSNLRKFDRYEYHDDTYFKTDGIKYMHAVPKDGDVVVVSSQLQSSRYSLFFSPNVDIVREASAGACLHV